LKHYRDGIFFDAEGEAVIFQGDRMSLGNRHSLNRNATLNVLNLMTDKDLPERWKEKLEKFTYGKYRPDYKYRGSLGAYDFPSTGGVSIRFADGSRVSFRFAFLIEAREWQEVAVFTEHCGYHIFPLGDAEIEDA
jgi:hypothetical protein